MKRCTHNRVISNNIKVTDPCRSSRRNKLRNTGRQLNERNPLHSWPFWRLGDEMKTNLVREKTERNVTKRLRNPSSRDTSSNNFAIWSTPKKAERESSSTQQRSGGKEPGQFDFYVLVDMGKASHRRNK